MKDTQKPEEKKPARRSVMGHIVDIINPFSDFKYAYQKGILPLVTKLKTLKAMHADRPKEYLTFEQAVKFSGRTVPQLLSLFRSKYIFWSALMIGCAVFALGTLFLISNATDVPAVTMQRAVTWLIILIAASSFSYVKTLSAVYRHWQLRNKRVSIAEGGTFQDFTKEVRPVLDVITLKYQTTKWK